MSILILVAVAFGVGKALEKTGAAGVLASTLVDIGIGLGPIGLLAAVYPRALGLLESHLKCGCCHTRLSHSLRGRTLVWG